MRRALVAFIVLAAGCSATRRTEGQWSPGKSLAANPKILLLQVMGREPEACQKVTSALLGMLSQKGYRAVLSTVGQQSGAAAIDQAAKDGFDYVLAGNLTLWGDEVELTVNLFEVSSRQSVATAKHYAHKRPAHVRSRGFHPRARGLLTVQDLRLDAQGLHGRSATLRRFAVRV